MSGAAGKLFGKLAVEFGYVDDDQVRDAVKIQEALAFQGRPLALGSILRNLGYMTADEMQEILDLQREDAASDLYRREAALFGEIAIENGFATRGQVEAALKIQESMPESFKIGSILVSRNAMTHEQRDTVLKAIERIVRDAKAGGAAPTPSRPAKVEGARQRPFSGLFLFDADGAGGDEGDE